MKKIVTFLLGICTIMILIMPQDALAHRRYYGGHGYYYGPRYGYSYYHDRPYYRPYHRYHSHYGYGYPRYDRYYWDDSHFCY